VGNNVATMDIPIWMRDVSGGEIRDENKNNNHDYIKFY